MTELKTNMILDGGNYKLSYTKDGKQNKLTIGNEKEYHGYGSKKDKLRGWGFITIRITFRTFEEAGSNQHICRKMRIS